MTFKFHVLDFKYQKKKKKQCRCVTSFNSKFQWVFVLTFQWTILMWKKIVVLKLWSRSCRMKIQLTNSMKKWMDQRCLTNELREDILSDLFIVWVCTYLGGGGEVGVRYKGFLRASAFLKWLGIEFL